MELEDRIVAFAARCVKVCAALPVKNIGVAAERSEGRARVLQINSFVLLRASRQTTPRLARRSPARISCISLRCQ